MLMEDIFGTNNFLCSFIWVNEGNIDNQSKIKTNHEYIVVFSKRESNFEPGAIIDPNIEEDSKLLKNNISNTIIKNGPKNPISELVLPPGFPANFKEGTIFPKKEEEFWPKFENPIEVRDWRLTSEARLLSGWSSKTQCEIYIGAGHSDIVDRKGQNTRFKITASGAVIVEKDRSEQQSHVLTVLSGLGTVQEASSNLKRLGVKFDYPKPVRLIAYLIKALCPEDDGLVLDSFAGSGTTGHAVLDLNARDGGKRRFILVEMDRSISESVTAPRLEAVMNVTGAEGGVHSGFRFCTLGEPLFDADGNVSAAVTYADLAAHVFFCETGSPIPQRVHGESCLIGIFRDRAVYLLHAADSFGVASPNAGNVLTAALLEALPLPATDFNGARIVYAEGCTIPDDRLNALGVTFKQIPYQIEGL